MTERIWRSRLRHRWWRRQLKCALGFHGWCMGPFTADGRWQDEAGELQPIPTDFHPYFCGFGSPWCKARRRMNHEQFMRHARRIGA